MLTATLRAAKENTHREEENNEEELNANSG